jgi:hypothetical protein
MPLDTFQESKPFLEFLRDGQEQAFDLETCSDNPAAKRLVEVHCLLRCTSKHHDGSRGI